MFYLKGIGKLMMGGTLLAATGAFMLLVGSVALVSCQLSRVWR